MLILSHLCPPFLQSPSLWKHSKQSARPHWSLGNWFDFTIPTLALIPPSSTTSVFVPSGCLPFLMFSLTFSDSNPLGVAGTVSVLVAPRFRNQVSFWVVASLASFISIRSCLDLNIFILPSRWLDNSTSYLPTTLLNTVLLNEVECLLYLILLENEFRKKTFLSQLSPGEQFRRRRIPSSKRMERFLAVENAVWACTTFRLDIGFL